MAIDNRKNKQTNKQTNKTKTNKQTNNLPLCEKKAFIYHIIFEPPSWPDI